MDTRKTQNVVQPIHPQQERLGEKSKKAAVAHEEIDVLVEELRGLEADQEAFAAKFQELRTKVEQHVQDEESRMFPQAEQELEDQLEDLRDEMQEIKEQLLA